MGELKEIDIKTYGRYYSHDMTRTCGFSLRKTMSKDFHLSCYMMKKPCILVLIMHMDILKSMAEIVIYH